MTFNKAETVRLFGSKPTFVSVSMRYEIVETDDSRKGPWKVSTRGWVYTISDEAQALAEYHWHPVSASHVTTPHVHLGGKAHYPTGRVLIEEVLDFAVDHGAEPRDPARWSALRDDNRAKFLRGATWGAGPT